MLLKRSEELKVIIYSRILIPLLIFIISTGVTHIVVYNAATMSSYPEPIDYPGIWHQWDSNWYLRIVNEGYSYQYGDQASVAFFPLFPVLTRFFSLIIPNTHVSALIVSNLARLAISILLFNLMLLETQDQKAAFRVLLYYFLYPTAFFLASAYSQSLFVALFLASVFLLRVRKFGWAVVFAMLASSARLAGVILWGVIILEWLQVRNYSQMGVRGRA